MKKNLKTKIIILEILIIFILLIPVIFNNYQFFYLIVSDSMNPVIYKNDIVLVKNNNISDYKNKIIAFYDPTRSVIIVHRVMGKEFGYFITKGDNSTFVDEYRVSEENIVGEVVFALKTSGIFK
ncbi:MAG: signal peptidase I [Patescibacteria group bacterium]|jgi:signal peptidase I|nr:signal peptidase I [Patescibacteria group bacterium]